MPRINPQWVHVLNTVRLTDPVSMGIMKVANGHMEKILRTIPHKNIAIWRLKVTKKNGHRFSWKKKEKKRGVKQMNNHG